MNEALLIARLYFGLGLAAHGVQKLFGWFGGYGLHQTGEFMVKIGFPERRGTAFAAAAGLGEAGGGLLVALGLLGPVGPALMVAVMLVAAGTVHIKNGFFATSNGVETPLNYAAGAFILAFVGFGHWSLDNLLSLHLFTLPRDAWIAVGVATLGAMANLMVRGGHPAPTPQATS